MKRSRYSTCSWIAFACATAALLICFTNLVLWQLRPIYLLNINPGRPVMVPNSAIAIGFATLSLLFLGNPGERIWKKFLAAATGILLLIFGGSSMVEAALQRRIWINHFYFELFFPNRWELIQFMNVPSPIAGLAFLLLGTAFLLWHRHYWISQTLIFANLALSTAALLGHVYEVQFFYAVTSEFPLSGMSIPTAASLALLCMAMLFSKPRESVVRFALTKSPTGALLTRLGLGGIIGFLVFGLLAALQFPLASLSTPNARSTVSFALFGGLFLMIWSSIRALERMEQERRKALFELEAGRERLQYAQRLAKLGYWHWDLLTDQIYASEEIFHLLGVPVPDSPIHYDRLLHAMHPEDRRRVNNAIYDSIAGHRHLSVEYRVIQPDG